jgi:Flp pilus assembly protein TadD
LAKDLRITIPRRSELTLVQRLNREGVDALRKNNYEKAEALFYKAYLFDPTDPFTLNNLGYISELRGQLDRAEKFYDLAAKQGCNAVIDLSNAKPLQGKPMMYALDTLKNVPMRVNRMNVLAIEMLSQDRGFEAESLLKQTLPLDPHNPFTLNNLGVAEEATGDFESALKYYDQAAESGSMEPIVITLNHSWRGKPVSEMAAKSAEDLRKRMRHLDLSEVRATMLEMRGVSAINQNDWSSAKADFLQAYSIDPDSAFALNNLGYSAERDGDLETAQFYYAKARKAWDANVRVGLATQSAAEGQHLSDVAGDSGRKVADELEAYSRTRREQQGPIELIPRNNGSNHPQGSPSKPPLETSPGSPEPGSPEPRSPDSRSPAPQSTPQPH